MTVSCIGGGPGSDFLGVIQHLIDRGFAGNLLCYLLDREETWGDNWSDLGTRWPDLQLRPATFFQAFNVTDETSWERQHKYLKADLFTFVYFASEVRKLEPAPEPFFMHLFERARPGALFLYVDNDADIFTDWFHDLTTKASLTLLIGHSCDKRLPTNEEKTDLGVYIERYGSPRLKADVVCRIYQKPI